MSAPVRVLIVDDEPVARAHLRTLLTEHPGLAVSGECGNGRDAVDAIRSESPDLVLLDIQMPELDGFGVVREIGVEQMPVVVFVTAHDEHALEAFRVHAFDYLLKPIDRDRLTQTLARATEQVRRGRGLADGVQLERLLEQLGQFVGAREARRERLAIRVDGRVLFLDPDHIDWIEAVDDYARLHLGRQSHLVRETLAHLEARLPATKFMRVHRSTIVNVGRVKEVQPWFQGNYVLILADGTRLTSGRSYRERLQRFLHESL